MNEIELSLKKIFIIFLKAGCAFGGGLAVILAIERELVEKEKLIDREEFLTMYGIGKIVPSGTVTALALGFGYKYKKLPGALVALAGIMLPGFTLTIILAMLYDILRGTSFFELMNVSILPAAVGLIVIAALNMGKDVFRSPVLLFIAFTSFVASFFLNVNPSVVLLGGAVICIFILRIFKEGKNVTS